MKINSWFLILFFVGWFEGFGLWRGGVGCCDLLCDIRWVEGFRVLCRLCRAQLESFITCPAPQENKENEFTRILFSLGD